MHQQDHAGRRHSTHDIPASPERTKSKVDQPTSGRWSTAQRPSGGWSLIGVAVVLGLVGFGIQRWGWALPQADSPVGTQMAATQAAGENQINGSERGDNRGAVRHLSPVELLRQIAGTDKRVEQIKRENAQALRNVNRQVRLPGPARSPNLLVVVVPEFAAADFSPDSPVMRLTPHLKKLAESSLRISHFRSAHPNRLAARWALLTGQNPSPVLQQSMPRFEIARPKMTMPAMLWQGGYDTTFVGDWAAAAPADDYDEAAGEDAANQPIPERTTTVVTPLDCGFDQWSGVLTTEAARSREWLKHWKTGGQIPFALPAKLPTPIDCSSATMLQVDAALSMHAARRRPFYLQVHLPRYVADGENTLVRLPTTRPASENASAETAAPEWTADWSPYLNTLQHLDRDVGAMQDRLVAHGLDKSTIVIFTALTAPNFPRSDQSSSTSSTPATTELMWAAGQLHEGNLRVPFAIRHPLWSVDGQEVIGNGATWDLLPTLAHLTLTHWPEQSPAAKSLVPMLRTGLRGTDQSPLIDDQRLFYWRTANGAQAAIRGNWKALVRPGNSAIQLFDLAKDFRESKDLSRDEPDRLKNLMQPTP